MNASLITLHLWVGAVPSNDEELHKYFDRLLIVDDEKEYTEDMYPSTQMLHLPMKDPTLTEEEESKAIMMGTAVAGWMRRDKTVLVCCKRGLNRAALIGSIALLRMGVDARQAVQRMRTARGALALNGPHYLELLSRLEETWSPHNVRYLLQVPRERRESEQVPPVLMAALGQAR